MKEIDSDN